MMVGPTRVRESIGWRTLSEREEGRGWWKPKAERRGRLVRKMV